MPPSFVITPSDTVLIQLGNDVIPPFGVGKLVAKQTLVLDKADVDTFADLPSPTFENVTIQFPLDLPGGASSVPNDDNWGIGASGFDAKPFSDRGAAGKGVLIGIADSGMDSTHPTFAKLLSDGRLTAFAAFGSDGSKQPQHASDGSLIPDSKATPTFTHWHGTHCAAVLVGQPTDGKVRGLATDASLAVALVLQISNTGTVASINSGIAWLADQKCDIVSLSLGWPGKHEEWALAVATLIEQGTVVVAAVGNEFGVPGEPPSRSPANYPLDGGTTGSGMLISVGAFDVTGQIWDNSGAENVDWSAVTVELSDGTTKPSQFASAPVHAVPVTLGPGVDIISAIPGNQYLSATGSSQATPHVAALIAVVLSVLRTKDANATARDAATLVLSSIVPPTTPNPQSGRGKINIANIIAQIDTIVTPVTH